MKTRHTKGCEQPDETGGRKAFPRRERGAVRGSAATGPRAAFTLVEVVLAVGIAAAIFLVLLFFYQQAANLRTQLLEEADRLSTVRLLMNQLEGELQAVPGRCFYKPPLSGDARSIQFVKTGLPSRSAWAGGSLGRSASPESDLRLVRYSLAGEGTNIAGLVRTEEPMVQKRQVVRSQVTVELPAATNRAAPPQSSELRYLRFRYWDGTVWQDAWHLDQMPRGLEITLASESVPEDVVLEESGVEMFRRVIALPAGKPLDDTIDILTEGSTNATTEVWP